MKGTFTRSVLGLALGAFLLAGMPAGAYAGMIGTASALAADAPAARDANLARVAAGLGRADVQAKLERLGVDPAAAVERAAALSDQELAQLADRLDALPAGGDFEIFAVLGVIFLILLILDYVGAIHIFSKGH